MSTKRIIVTGGAGFVGSHLVDSLLQEGHEVVVVDNLLTGSPDNLADAREHENFTFIDHDLTESLYLDEDVDEIFHLASPASPEDYGSRPIHTMKVGALGTLHMLGLAKAHGARFLISSTSEVYGDPEVNPQPEAYWGNVNPIGPRGVYDEAKRFAEALTMAYHRKHDVDTRIARIFNTYGPRMRPHDGRAIPNFLRQSLNGNPITVYGDGTQTRSFCYVDDMVQGLRALMERGSEQPVNLGNPQEMRIIDLAHLIQDLTGTESPVEFRDLPKDDPQVRRPDISRARQELGWQPITSLKEGLAATLASVTEDSDWYE